MGVTKSETRRLGYIRDALVEGYHEDALRQLCALMRCAIPAVPPRTVTPARVVEGVVGERQPDPKPARYVSPSSVRSYLAAHPLCEIDGCGQPGQVHHIRNRSLGGGDEWTNLLTLDARHHLAGSSEGFHHLGPRRFLNRFCRRLSDASVQKIVAAWKLEPAELAPETREPSHA